MFPIWTVPLRRVLKLCSPIYTAVFSNIYGPDDQISPRGMIVRFLEISSDDRKVIAKEAFEHLKSKEVDSYQLEALQTIILEKGEIESKAA
jgi:hypothetical protein